MSNKIRILVIPDLHGSDAWESAVASPYDFYIFLGDYTDSFTHSNVQILNNLKKIIGFKKKNPNKAILLRGNHDACYCDYVGGDAPRCAGFRPEAAHDLWMLFKQHKKLFQVAYQIDNYLFTHAGVSERWYNKHRETILEFWDIISDKDEKTGVNMADVLNAMFETRHRRILYEVGAARDGSGVGGPFWADYKETKMGIIPNYIQVVGHTKRDDIETIKFPDKTSITYCDVLHSKPNKFLTIEI